MNKVIVERFNRDDRPTMGRVTIRPHDRAPEVTVGFSLEDRHRDAKVAGDTAIPAGRYDLRWRQGGRWAERFARKGFQGSLEVCGVPNFTAILIHPGNTKRDTAGCLLVGRIGDLDARTIGKSRPAVELLYSYVKSRPGDWVIEYRDPD